MKLSNEKTLEILVEWNIWEGENARKGIPRDITEEIKGFLKEKEIIFLKGIRRSGKSTIMFQLMEEIADKKQTLYVNFEEPLFSKGDFRLLDQIYQVYRENINPSKKSYLFLDEVQNVAGWEKWVRSHNEKSEDKIIVTGSSAKLLSSDIATVLTGRHYSFRIFPLSFSEFLRFNGIEIKSAIGETKQKPIIKNLLGKFIKYGGFPAVVLQKEVKKKVALLKEYFDDILYKDVVGRHQIRDLKTLQELASFLMANVSNLLSYNKTKNFLDIPMDVVRNYVSYMEEAYLVSEVSKFSYKAKEQIANPKKIYCQDNGLRNAVAFSFSKDYGRLVENLVFNAILPRDKEIFYHQDKHEVDFLIKEKGNRVKEAIQVCFSDLDDKKVREREVGGILEGLSSFSMNSGTIITSDYEETIKEGKHLIHFVPLWKWLLH